MRARVLAEPREKSLRVRAGRGSEEFLTGLLLKDPAPGQKSHPFADRPRETHLMGAEHDLLAAIDEPVDEVEYLAGDLGIERRSRFI